MKNFFNLAVGRIYNDTSSFLLLVSFVCVFGILGVTISEMLGLRPCMMCKVQRFIVFAIILSSIVSLLFYNIFQTSLFLHIGFYLTVLMIYSSFAFAVYQFSVEKGWLEMPAFCVQSSIGVKDASILEDLISSSTPPPPCNKPQKVGMFSIAEYTFFGTLLLASFATSVVAYRRYHKNRK